LIQQSTPYWWDTAPPITLPPIDMKPKCDVAIVGAGYTGLSAAISLARAGRQVQVFDRLRPGEGASTRNGGIASGSIRPSFRRMVRKFGKARATAIQFEAKAAREALADFIAREGIECEFQLTGRFTGAANAREYEELAREADLLRKELEVDAYAVPASEQHRVLGTEFYHGGMVRNDIGGLHPAKLHRGLMRLAQDAGALIHGETGVLGVVPRNGGCEVATARGAVQAEHVIVGTNGYTDGFDPWLRRRLVPVRSRIIATAPLSNNLMAELMPKGVMCAETRNSTTTIVPHPTVHESYLAAETAPLSASQPGRPTICDARSPTSFQCSTASRSRTVGLAMSP
jgi:glycine/D-amino acid oxidase-like deaminating enzyme